MIDVIWRDLPSGELRGELKSIVAIVPSPDGKSFWGVQHRRDNRLGRWDLATGANERSFPIKAVGWLAVADGGKLVVISDAKRMMGVDAATGKQTFEWPYAAEELVLEGVRDPIAHAAVSADGRFIAIIM